MKSVIKRLLDALGLFGFVFLIGLLCREQLKGTFLGDIWESIFHLLFGWIGK